MPSIERLCALLGVRSRRGDELHPEDLKSLASYRAALHAALIRRAPGKYPRKWQAQRLGVSKDSCRRYEKRTGVRVQPTFRSWTVSWGNMDRIFPDEPEMGHFLEDEKGKRYPPLRVIARRLLAQGKRLLFRSQDVNHYEVRGREALAEVWSCVVPMPDKETRQPVALWVDGARKVRRAQRKIIEGNAALVEEDTAIVQRPRLPRLTRPVVQSRNAVFQGVHKPPVVANMGSENVVDPDGAEACVERLYIALRNINPQRSITRKKARQFVGEYGVTQVERGLRVLLKRRNIRNPAGFLQTLLRSQHAYG